MRVNLRVISGPHEGKTYSFDQADNFLIGRGTDAHLRLPDDRFFSRHHCLLEIAPPRIFLRDLSSTNGTFVNGEKVQTANLKNGDVIQGGQTALVVEAGAEQVFFNGSANAPYAENSLIKPFSIGVICVVCGNTSYAEASRADEKMTYICGECREKARQQPQPIRGYEFLKNLGQGGMGSVALAREERTGRLVAVKTLLPEIAVSQQSLNRFQREISVAAELRHPNIVEYITHGEENGIVYLVTEFVNGKNAQQLAKSRGGRMDFREVAQILLQMLDALNFAHSKGFIHRDIKEQNILIIGDYPHLTAKLTDFGLAKSFKQTGLSGITLAGDVAGTIAYMPPEQIRDFRQVQPISDIYALGMMAYSLLTGTVALDLPPRSGIAETVKAIFESPIVPLSHRIGGIPPNFAAVIESALKKDVRERWQTAAAMHNALLTTL